jgi:arginase
VQISLIQAPYWLGNAEVPMAAGPTRIVEAGAADALREAGNEVELVAVEASGLDSDGYYVNEAKGSFSVMRLVAERVREAVEHDFFPLVLATNCLNTVGIVAGGSTDVGVVWFDAHADFSTTETSLSGFLDGQGLSILTGTGWSALRETIPGYRSVPETNVVLAGVRDTDLDEDERLARSAIAVVPPDELEGGLEAKLDALRERVADVHLHLDLDVLDRSEGMVNLYAAEGGPSAAEVAAAIRAVGERFRIRSAAMTAYDPSADPEGRVPPVAVRLLLEIDAAAAAGMATRA